MVPEAPAKSRQRKKTAQLRGIFGGVKNERIWHFHCQVSGTREAETFRYNKDNIVVFAFA